MSVQQTVIRPGAGVDAADGRLGTVDEVRVRPETGELALLVVRRGWSDRLLHVAAAQVDRVEGDGTVRLRVTRAEAERLAAEVRDAAPGAAGGRRGRRREAPGARAGGALDRGGAADRAGRAAHPHAGR